MTEEEFSRICRACDQVLGAKPTVERLAIGWLHVLSEHPSVTPRYESLIAPSRPSPRLPLRSVLGQLRTWATAGDRSGGASDLPERADAVIVSHVLNEGQIGAPEDFYFGRAAETLAEEGISSAVLFMNWTSRSPSQLGSRWPRAMAPRWSFRPALSLREEISIRRRMGLEASRLRDEGRAAADPFLRRVYEEAARNAVTGTSLFSLRLYLQMSTVMARLKPRAVIVTFEGHPWERLAFIAARRENPGVRCIGYHHTILFARSHAVLRPLGPKYDPDVILTAGDVTRERFSEAYAGRGVRVRTMGIHRRQDPVRAADERTRPFHERPATCLVVPDGLPSEVVHLFDFALAAARECPEVSFILRLHPILSLAQIQKSYPRFRALPPNARISADTLGEDIGASKWVLYRGSNAAIYAVMAGLRPVYVAKRDELSIDCLHQVRTWKRTVTSAGDFRDVITADHRELPEEEEAAAAAASEFCRRFFLPLDRSVLTTEVKEAG